MTALLQNLAQDLRFALRQLRRAPAFAATAVLTIALAIGIATAVFSVIDATLLRPLPYPLADRIVTPVTLSESGYNQPASWPEYRDWRHLNSSTLEALATFEPSSINFEPPTGSPSPVRLVSGSDNFFQVFAVAPLLGRTFLPGEDQPGRNNIVVLGYDLWQGSFGGRADILGSTLKLDGVPNTIVGVMPAGFRFPINEHDALYRPVHIPAERLESRGAHAMLTIARIKPGVSIAVAQANFQHVLDELARAYPDYNQGRRVRLETYAHNADADAAQPLRLLGFAVLGVLLIGCVNLAGLLLARGVRRQRELSLRAALGAARTRMLRQLLTEAALLSVAGAVLGIALAAALLQLMRQLLVHSLARGAEVSLNLTVLGAAIGLSLLTGLLAGVLPALQSARTAPALALRSGSAATGTSRAQSRLRGSLIVIQVAVALGLLLSSGLVLQNLRSLLTVDLGFSLDHLLTEELTVNAVAYTGRSISAAVYQPMLDRLHSVPGITAAGLTNMLPVRDWGSNGDLPVLGQPPLPHDEEPLAELRFVVPGAIEALGARVVAGRALSSTLDTATSLPVVTVNQAYVRKYLPAGASALGHQIALSDRKLTIVGVTSDLRQNLYERPMPEVDVPAAQVPAATAEDWGNPGLAHMQLVVRSTLPPAAPATAIRDILHQIDPTIPFRAPATMHEILDDTLTLERLESWLFGTFAALALLLSLVGLYGTLAHEVELRTRDIGVRMALGATRARVVRSVLARTATLLAFGIAAGALLSFASRRLLGSVIELHPAHNLPLALALTALLSLAGLAAALPPARRAASIDPNTALRAD